MFYYVPEWNKGGEWTTKTETNSASNSSDLETGFEIILGKNGKPVSKEMLEKRIFSKKPVCSGYNLKPNAQDNLNEIRYVIAFELKDKDKHLPEDFTRANINHCLAVFYDKKLATAPTVKDVIPGRGIIEGQFTRETAKMIAEQINSEARAHP